MCTYVYDFNQFHSCDVYICHILICNNIRIFRTLKAPWSSEEADVEARRVASQILSRTSSLCQIPRTEATEAPPPPPPPPTGTFSPRLGSPEPEQAVNSSAKAHPQSPRCLGFFRNKKCFLIVLGYDDFNISHR